MGQNIYLHHHPLGPRLNMEVKEEGTTANEGTRGSLVRMTPDVVYYSWAGIDTSI